MGGTLVKIKEKENYPRTTKTTPDKKTKLKLFWLNCLFFILKKSSEKKTNKKKGFEE